MSNMKVLLAVTLLGFIAVSHAFNCGADTKVNMTMATITQDKKDTDRFFFVKGWRGQITDPKKCVEGAGGIELTGDTCLAIKPRVESTLVKVCASVKHATEIEMSYIKGGESHFPSGDMVEKVNAADEFDRTCWVLRNDKPQPPKNVSQVRICRVPEFSTNDVLKMEDVYVTMCTA